MIAPTAPPRLHTGSVTNKSLKLLWDGSTDPSGVITYDVYVGSTKVANTAPGVTSYTSKGLQASTGYTFSVRAVDPNGHNSSAATTAIVTSAPPNKAPGAPTVLHTTDLGENFISLAWTAGTDDSGVAKYRIYRNGVKLATEPTETFFTDTGLDPQTQYTYIIKSIDGAGLLSPSSSPLSATTLAVPTHDALAGFAATDFDGTSGGLSTEGDKLTDLDEDEWVLYRNVNFGDSGANFVRFNLSLNPNNRGGEIELRLDNVNGTVIGRFDPQATGSFSTYFNQQGNVDTTTGTHDLYLVFKNRDDLANLHTITFRTQKLTRIMALGDSITQAFDSTSSYRYYLWHKLLDNGKNADFVGSTQESANGNPPNFDFDQNHEGHAGWRADQIAQSASFWASQSQPQIVLLHIGTNDIEQGQSINSTLSDIGSIINALRNAVPDVKILLAQIFPLRDHQTEVDNLNALIPGLAASLTESNSPIIVVDQNTGFSAEIGPDDDSQGDGIHPNSDAEQEMANRWYAALASLLQ